jgi:hypothetical protein
MPDHVVVALQQDAAAAGAAGAAAVAGVEH